MAHATRPIDVSLILNLHREGALAAATLASLREAVAFAQVHAITCELVIVLDRADAATRRIVARFAPGVADAVRIIETEHGSLGLARNAGIARARGTYLRLCDGDDLLSYNSIAAKYFEMERRGPKTILVAEWIVMFDAHHAMQRYLPQRVITPLAFLDTHPYVSCIFFHRDLTAALRFGDLRLSSGYAYEDWFFNCEAAALGYEFEIAPDTILFYRQRHDSLVRQANQISVKQIPPSRLFEPERFRAVCAESYAWTRRGGRPQAPRRAARFDESHVGRPLIAAAAAMEPALDLAALANETEYDVSVYVDLKVGQAYYEVCEPLCGKAFTDVVLTAAARDAAAVALIETLVGDGRRPLVLIGDGAGGDLPVETATVVDLAARRPQIGENGVDLISLKLIQSAAPDARLHLIPGPASERFVRKFGRGLEDRLPPDTDAARLAPAAASENSADSPREGDVSSFAHLASA